VTAGSYPFALFPREPEPGAWRVLRLDHERRQALEDLISHLSDLVVEAQKLTNAVLGGDRGAVGLSAALLRAMSAEQVLDLARLTDVYCALRRAAVDGQPGDRQPAERPGTISAAVPPGPTAK
jgi:hypothetical protein